MATEVGSLYYDLDIKDDKLDASLGSADKKVAKFGDSISDSGENLRKNLNKAAAGFAVVGAGLTLVAKNATDFTVDQVKAAKTLSREIGTTVEDASRLTEAFKRMGVSSEQASTSFGIFSKNIVASAKNVGQTEDAFSRLGVKIKDTSGKQKDFNTILFEVADRFKAMPNGIDKTAASMELFGRSGKDLLPVLNLGSEGIQDLEKQADKLGLTLNANTIGKVNELVKSQKDLKAQTDSLKISIGTATAPILTEFNTKLNEVLQNLLATDSPMRGLTANVIAFGGPVATGASALVGFAANLATVTTAMGVTGSAAAATTGAMTALSLVSLTGWGVLIVAALGSVVLAFNQIDKAIDKAKKGIEDLSKQKVQIGNTSIKTGATSDIGLVEQLRRSFGGFAEGTGYAPGGMSWVGEKGPELMNVPHGAQIIPSDVSKSIVNNSNTSKSTSVNVDLRGAVFRDQNDVRHMVDLLGRNVELAAQGLPTLRGGMA